MFSLDWDKGLLQEAMGSLDDKQEKNQSLLWLFALSFPSFL